MLALAQGARGAHHATPFPGEEPSDLGSDAAARSRHQHALAVEPSHGLSLIEDSALW
jgi:hypothetical protein